MKKRVILFGAVLWAGHLAALTPDFSPAPSSVEDVSRKAPVYPEMKLAIPFSCAVWIQNAPSNSDVMFAGDMISMSVSGKETIKRPACFRWYIEINAQRISSWKRFGEMLEKLDKPVLVLYDIDGKELSKLAPYLNALKGLDLINCPDLRDDDLKWLPRGDQLSRLRIVSCEKITDKGMEHLKDLSSLQELSLAGTNITNAGLKQIEGLKELQELDLSSTPIGNRGQVSLETLKKLRVLNLRDTAIDDDGLLSLAKINSLERLSPPGKITDKGLRHIKDMTSLRGLNLCSTQITDQGLAYLEDLTRLQELFLPPQTSDSGLAYLKGLVNLQVLFLRGARITDKSIPILENFKKLKWLALSGTEISPAGYDILRKSSPEGAVSFSGPHPGADKEGDGAGGFLIGAIILGVIILFVLLVRGVLRRRRMCNAWNPRR